MSKFIMLDNMYVRLDDIVAFELESYGDRILKIWMRDDEWVIERQDLDGKLFEKLSRAMEAV